MLEFAPNSPMAPISHRVKAKGVLKLSIMQLPVLSTYLFLSHFLPLSWPKQYAQLVFFLLPQDLGYVLLACSSPIQLLFVPCISSRSLTTQQLTTIYPDLFGLKIVLLLLFIARMHTLIAIKHSRNHHLTQYRSYLTQQSHHLTQQDQNLKQQGSPFNTAVTPI